MAVSPGRRGAIAFFVTVCVCLVVLAIALNIGWIVLNWREAVPLILGVFVIAGLILNTTFLIREIRRNEQHDAFVNSVTHELKTPVTSIRLHLETLKVRGHTIDETKRQEFYDTMLEDSERLLNTIEQVLRTGRAGRAPLDRARVNVRALVEECLAQTRTRRHLPDDALTLTPSGSHAAPVDVIGDKDELRGAVMNLLDNAVKYSGPEIKVDVEVARTQGNRVLVRVTDQGVGMPQEETKRIFRRFYRIPGAFTQRVKGTGLGLFIVHTAAKRHGGRAFATSPGVGHGSTFTVDLPAAPPVETA
jgi:two-component system sensor histidine kinase SenX3